MVLRSSPQSWVSWQLKLPRYRQQAAGRCRNASSWPLTQHSRGKCSRSYKARPERLNKSRLNVRALKVAVEVRWFNCHGKALLPRSFKQAAQLHTQAKKSNPHPVIAIIFCVKSRCGTSQHITVITTRITQHFHMRHARPCCSSDCSSNSINRSCLWNHTCGEPTRSGGRATSQ